MARRTITRADLFDLEDCANLIGVKHGTLHSYLSPNRRHMYRIVEGMPDPIGRISAAPVWDAHAVEAWWARKARG